MNTKTSNCSINIFITRSLELKLCYDETRADRHNKLNFVETRECVKWSMQSKLLHNMCGILFQRLTCLWFLKEPTHFPFFQMFILNTLFLQRSVSEILLNCV